MESHTNTLKNNFFFSNDASPTPNNKFKKKFKRKSTSHFKNCMTFKNLNEYENDLKIEEMEANAKFNLVNTNSNFIKPSKTNFFFNIHEKLPNLNSQIKTCSEKNVTLKKQFTNKIKNKYSSKSFKLKKESKKSKESKDSNTRITIGSKKINEFKNLSNNNNKIKISPNDATEFINKSKLKLDDEKLSKANDNIQLMLSQFAENFIEENEKMHGELITFNKINLGDKKDKTKYNSSTTPNRNSSKKYKSSSDGLEIKNTNNNEILCTSTIINSSDKLNSKEKEIIKNSSEYGIVNKSINENSNFNLISESSINLLQSLNNKKSKFTNPKLHNKELLSANLMERIYLPVDDDLDSNNNILTLKENGQNYFVGLNLDEYLKKGKTSDNNINTTKNNELINFNNTENSDISVTFENNEKINTLNEQNSNLNNKKLYSQFTRFNSNFHPKNYPHNKNKKFRKKQTKTIPNNNNERSLQEFENVYDSFSDEEIEIEEIKPPAYITLPESPLRKTWDIIIAIFIVYSIIISPYQLAFEVRSTSENMALVYADIIVDILFLFDLILNFFTAFYDEDENLIITHRKIILEYLCGYFIFDLISSIPFTLITYIMEDESSTLSFNYANIQKISRIARFYRLFKWTRIFRIFRLTKSNSSHHQMIKKLGKFQSSVHRFLKFIVFFIIITYLTSCVWCFIGTSEISYGIEKNWISQSGLQDKSNLDIFITSLYFNWGTIFTVGYGDIISNSIQERGYLILFLMIGGSIYSFVISSLSNIFSLIDIKTEIFIKKELMLEEICRENRVSDELYEKIRKSINHDYSRWNNDKIILLDSLPGSLKNQLYLKMYEKQIKHLNFFQNQAYDFIIFVVPLLKSAKYCKGDILVSVGEFVEEMYLIIKGVVSLHLGHKYENYEIGQFRTCQHFGDILMYVNEQSDYDFLVKTKICELFILSKSDFANIKLNFKNAINDLLQLAYYSYESIEKRRAAAVDYFNQHKTMRSFKLNYLNFIKLSLEKDIFKKKQGLIQNILKEKTNNDDDVVGGGDDDWDGDYEPKERQDLIFSNLKKKRKSNISRGDTVFKNKNEINEFNNKKYVSCKIPVDNNFFKLSRKNINKSKSQRTNTEGILKNDILNEKELTRKIIFLKQMNSDKKSSLIADTKAIHPSKARREIEIIENENSNLNLLQKTHLTCKSDIKNKSKPNTSHNFNTNYISESAKRIFKKYSKKAYTEDLTKGVHFNTEKFRLIKKSDISDSSDSNSNCNTSNINSINTLIPEKKKLSSKNKINNNNYNNTNTKNITNTPSKFINCQKFNENNMKIDVVEKNISDNNLTPISNSVSNSVPPSNNTSNSQQLHNKKIISLSGTPADKSNLIYIQNFNIKYENASKNNDYTNVCKDSHNNQNTGNFHLRNHSMGLSHFSPKLSNIQNLTKIQKLQNMATSNPNIQKNNKNGNDARKLSGFEAKKSKKSSRRYSAYNSLTDARRNSLFLFGNPHKNVSSKLDKLKVYPKETKENMLKKLNEKIERYGFLSQNKVFLQYVVKDFIEEIEDETKLKDVLSRLKKIEKDLKRFISSESQQIPAGILSPKAKEKRSSNH